MSVPDTVKSRLCVLGGTDISGRPCIRCIRASLKLLCITGDFPRGHMRLRKDDEHLNIAGINTWSQTIAYDWHIVGVWWRHSV